DDLDVAEGAEVVAARDQRVAQRRAVVYLAVADDLDRAVLVAERLLPARDIDDREPAHSESRLGVHDAAEVVGPAMDHDVAHGAPPAAAIASRGSAISRSASAGAASATFACDTVCAPIVHPPFASARTSSQPSIVPASARPRSKPIPVAAVCSRAARSGAASGT